MPKISESFIWFKFIRFIWLFIIFDLLLIDWFILIYFDLFQCLLEYLNYHIISIYAIICYIIVIGDSFIIYLSTIKKNVCPGIYDWIFL